MNTANASGSFDWSRWYASIPGIPLDWGQQCRAPAGNHLISMRANGPAARQPMGWRT